MDGGNARLLAEVGGAVAVLTGLIFVGLELRQNTSAVEAATFQGLTDASATHLLTIAADPELSRIVATANVSPAELNELDSVRFYILTRSYWVRMQNVFSQWQRGTLSDDDWQLYEAVICKAGDGANSGVGVMTFDDHREVLNPAFSEFVENCWSD
jgi:hypothetical protein